MITPNWPAPTNIHAYSTTVADGDMREEPSLPGNPHWLTQIHTDGIITLPTSATTADASITREKNLACIVRTADCLPVLLCDTSGTVVAAVHAGWRGLATHIIPKTVQQMQVSPDNLLVWLGPAIGPNAFEVRADVFNAFPDHPDAFTSMNNEQWHCDLYAIARAQLHSAGVDNLYGGEHCTHEESALFHSFRREGDAAGRMASGIYIS